MTAVTVIIPAYNPGAHLERSVASVLNQTHTDLELLVVDDGGSEDLSWVADRDDQARLVVQQNAGVSIARNVGVQLASHDLVAFLDQDDVWLPDKLERQMALWRQNPEASFYYTRFRWTRGDDAAESAPQHITYRGLLADQHVCLSSVLVSKAKYQSVGGHDPLLVQMQDYDLFLRLTMAFGEPLGVTDPLVDYHLHSNNVSRDYYAAYRERVTLIEKHQMRAERGEDSQTALACAAGLKRSRTLYGSQAFDGARAALHGRDPAALRHLARASRLYPTYTARAVSGWLMQKARPALRAQVTS